MEPKENSKISIKKKEKKRRREIFNIIVEKVPILIIWETYNLLHRNIHNYIVVINHG